MAGVFCEGGLIEMANLKRDAFNTYTLRLFKNNHTPAEADTIGAYTEANYDGYAAQAIGGFSSAVFTAGKARTTDATVYTFTPTGTVTPNDIYGYYITNPAGDLICAERYPAGPAVLDGPTKSFLVTLFVTDDNE